MPCVKVLSSVFLLHISVLVLVLVLVLMVFVVSMAREKVANDKKREVIA